MDRTIYSITVTETDKNRDFWATRPWLGDKAESLRSAPIIVLPWENFRENAEVLFPQGTTDFVKMLRKELPLVIAADSASYAEIALYSKVWRLPALFVTVVMLPTLTNALGNLISDQFKSAQAGDSIEMKLTIERQSGPCISLEYKGPPTRALDTIVGEVNRCIPSVSSVESHKEKIDHGKGNGAR